MSGKGTNSGVSFQQSASTHFLMHMLLDLPLGNIFEDDFEKEKVEEVFVETTDKIDDIKIVLSSEKKLFIQVKNNCSGSMKKDSDLYKSFEQVVKQYQLKKQNEYFVICTSLDTVKDVKSIKKLLHVIRNNPVNYMKNNFNMYEKKLLIKINNMLKEISPTIDKNSISSLLSKTYILIIDPSKKDYIMLLNYLSYDCSHTMAKLLWDSIQEDSINIASTGSSFSKEGIQTKYNSYLVKNTKQLIYNNIQNYSFTFDKDFYIRQNLQSSDYLLEITNKSQNIENQKMKTIRRFSTIEQAEEYLNMHDFEYQTINHFNQNDDIHYTQLMNEKMKIQLSQNGISQCIHCSNLINDKDKVVIEIDSLHIANNIKFKTNTIGVSHSKCIKPNDRYLGIISVSNSINEIDNIEIREWESIEKKGHGLLKNYLNQPEVRLSKDIIFIWEPFEEYSTEEKFCVQYLHFGGAISFEVYRQKLHRLTKKDAQTIVNNFSENYKKYLFSDKEEEQKKIKAEVIDFSTIIEKKYNKFENFYAPLISLSDGEEYLIIDDKIVFITDLFKLETFKEHCNENSIDISRYSSTFIKDDNHFDKIMTKHYYNDKIISAVFDPLLSNGSIFSGKNIMNINNAKKNIKANN